MKSTAQIKKPSKFASGWLETSAKLPEVTGSKNTSPLPDLSLELATEEQYKLMNQGVYISSLPILFALGKGSL